MTSINSNTESNKKYAIFCPFYITQRNKGNWIKSWTESIRKYESCDIFYSISYPTDEKKWDMNELPNNTLTTGDISLIHQIEHITLPNATKIFCSPNVEHDDAMIKAHKILKQMGYEYMIHIEQDVILKKKISTQLIDELIKSNCDILITDMINTNPITIDISIFCIKLDIDLNEHTIYNSSYVDYGNHNKYDIINFHNILNRNPLLKKYTSDELHQLHKNAFKFIFDNKLTYENNLIDTSKLASLLSESKTPIFVDVLRPFILHSYENNKLAIYKDFSDAVHIGASRSISPTTITPLTDIVQDYLQQPATINITINERKIPQAPFMTPRIRYSNNIKPVNVVIISKNQANVLPNMVDMLKTSLPNFKRIFVLDRCGDNSEQVLSNLNEKYVTNSVGVGFCAGTARSLGAKVSNQSSDLLILDGDRIPHNITEQLVYESLYYFDICLIKGETEPRKWFSNDFTYNPNYGLEDSHVWTCGFSIRREAINIISKISNNALFNNIFDGEYGWEDLHLGDIAYHSGLTCGGFPSTVYVEGELSLVYLDDKPRYLEQNKLRMYMREFLRNRSSSHSINRRIPRNESNHLYKKYLNETIEASPIEKPTAMSKNERRSHIETMLKHRDRIIVEKSIDN